jgi:hypothetical protein
VSAALATIGHNQPPSPFQLSEAEIGDLFAEAQNWLDGSGVKTDADGLALHRLGVADEGAVAGLDLGLSLVVGLGLFLAAKAAPEPLASLASRARARYSCRCSRAAKASARARLSGERVGSGAASQSAEASRGLLQCRRAWRTGREAAG